MGSLGALLELLYRAHEYASSVQAEFRDWDQFHESSTVVVEANKNDTPTLRWRGAGPQLATTECTRHIWFASPDRLRVEVRRRDRSLVRLGVRNGSRWWRWDRQAGGASGTMTGGGGPLPPLLSPLVLRPARLIPTLELDVTGDGVCAGREVVVVHARPSESPAEPHELSFRLQFDAEHGTLLRREILEDGRCLQLTEALRVSYDVEMDPERFVFAPRDQTAPVSAAQPPVKLAQGQHWRSRIGVVAGSDEPIGGSTI